jgi:hypothetical protein
VATLWAFVLCVHKVNLPDSAPYGKAIREKSLLLFDNEITELFAETCKLLIFFPGNLPAGNRTTVRAEGSAVGWT